MYAYPTSPAPPPPPPGYVPFAAYANTPSPSPQGVHGFYPARPPVTSPHRPHSRHASQDAGYAYSPRAQTYPSPRYSNAGYYSSRPAGYASPSGAAATSSGNPEYVSTEHAHRRSRSKSRRSREKVLYASRHKRRSSHSYRNPYEDDVDYDYDYYVYEAAAPRRRASFREPLRPTYYDLYYDCDGRDFGADQYYFGSQAYYDGYARDSAQTRAEPAEYSSPRYAAEESAPRRSRARRASHSSPRDRPGSRPTSSHKPAKPAKTTPPPPKASEEDARRHKIPQGYSLKNWDPTEEPILLLGSVFDANSLGKWIYDWTVYHHGAATPMSDMAGELWLLLIQLAGKIKRAEECLPRVRSEDNREMIEDFVEGGERLWDRLKKLLKLCEEPMLRTSKRGSSTLGKNAGVEFVESLYGRDRQLDKTEKLMANIRLWNMRFDANCEEVLRKPHA